MESKSNKIRIGVCMSIAFMLFSSYCGSGFATGRQIVQYYVQYGVWGLLTVFIPWIICGFIFVFAFDFCRVNKLRTYKDFAQAYFIPKIGNVFVLVFDILMVLTACVMLSSILASTGELICQMFGNEGLFWPGVICMTLLVIAMSSFGIKIILKFSSIVTPLIIALVLLITVLGCIKNSGSIAANLAARVVNPDPNMGLWAAVMASFAVVGQQSATITSLAASTTEVRSAKEARASVIIGFGLCATLGFCFVMMLLGYFPDIISESLAVLMVVNSFNSPILVLGYQILLLCAMITTACGFLFGFTERMSVYGKKLIPKDNVRKLSISCLTLAVSAAISAFGLVAIVAKGYTLVGYVNLPLMGAMLILGPIRAAQARKKQRESELS